jgi:poly(A) polymerase
MPQPLKDAIGLCKTIIRNGFDAYVVNTVLQNSMLEDARETVVDIATEVDFDQLQKIFPQVQETSRQEAIGALREGEALFVFYPTDTNPSSHEDASVVRLTPRLHKKLEERRELPSTLACPFICKATETYAGFADWEEKVIRLIGIPDETLKSNYLLGLRALRFSVNFNMPIEPNTWMAIVRSGRMIMDYVPTQDIMDEWRKVEAENLWHFVQLMYDAHILHELIPEVAVLSRVYQLKNESGEEETVLAHTIRVMRHYAEQLPYDWYGTVACLLHDVGKLDTAEYVDGKWHFYQHHHLGAKLARKIMRRLNFLPEDIDLVSHLVRYHKRFDSMLNERGIRRFKALDEYPRLIEMSRANINAREGSTRAFNHNMKYLERADIPEEMSEPLLNGNEIMEFANLKPGPAVGVIREALLKAQIAGEVTSVPEAVDFVCSYQVKEGL